MVRNRAVREPGFNRCPHNASNSSQGRRPTCMHAFFKQNTKVFNHTVRHLMCYQLHQEDVRSLLDQPAIPTTTTNTTQLLEASANTGSQSTPREISKECSCCERYKHNCISTRRSTYILWGGCLTECETWPEPVLQWLTQDKTMTWSLECLTYSK